LGPGFSEFASNVELQEIDKLPKLDDGPNDPGVDPKSENDIQALKTCWEPKVLESISGRLPENSYLSWNPRQYVFQGAEVMLDEDDEDEEDDDEDSSSDSDSDDSSISSAEIRENETDATTPESTTKIIPPSDTSPKGQLEVNSEGKASKVVSDDKSN